MKKSNIFIYLYIALCLIISGCKKKEPIAIVSVINSCIEPIELDYYNYNDDVLNKELLQYVEKMPVHLREYLHLKMTNRIVEHERCKSHVEERKSYEKCLLYLIEPKSYDKDHE